MPHQNDTIGLNQYGARLGEGSVYALCFAEGSEQAHHWQIFAGHTHGLCIQFDRDEFVDFLNQQGPDLLHGPMIYENLKQVRERSPIQPVELPFLKRDTFRAEAEYRVVAWEQAIFAGESYSVPMPAKMIRRVTLGPAMPRVLAETLKDVACSQNGCEHISFGISRLTNNASWASAIREGLSQAN